MDSNIYFSLHPGRNETRFFSGMGKAFIRSRASEFFQSIRNSLQKRTAVSGGNADSLPIGDKNRYQSQIIEFGQGYYQGTRFKAGAYKDPCMES